MAAPFAGDLAFLKYLNRIAIVKVVRASPGIARVDIAARTGLTKMAVGGLVSELLEEGWLCEGEASTRRAAGRPAQPLYPNTRVHALIGVEVGVDYLNVVGTDISGKVLHRNFREYHPETPQDTAGELARMIRGARDHASLRERSLLGVGVSVPGPVDDATSTLRVAPNLGWRKVRFLDLLRLHLPDLTGTWVLENEANAAAIGECSFRTGEKPELLVQLMLGRGVGCGIMIDGRILRGVGGYGGEIGHSVLHPDGPVCRCGNRGCAELYVSERALSIGLTGNDSPGLTLDRIVAQCEQDGARTLHDVGQHLGVLMANLLFTFSPSDLIVGGPLAKLGPKLLEPALRELRERVPADLLNHVRIALSETGVDSAAVGAAAAALEAHLSPTPALAARVARQPA